jgi:hypothetical protein
MDRGRSVAEREGTPLYGDPDEAYRVSGGVDQYVGAAGLGFPPASGTRNEPIRGPGSDVKRRPGSHGMELEIKGTDVILGPNNYQVQGLVLERMAANASAAQYAHADWVRRGMPCKQDFPDGTGRATGRIKAVHSFGLGPNVAMAADLGHDPIDTPIDHDYRRQPEGPVPGALDKYVGAAGVLAQPVGNASGFPRDHERSQFVTMGETAIEGIVARSELIATSRIPTTKPAAPRSNQMLGQQKKG